jgi:hypothetical protein
VEPAPEGDYIALVVSLQAAANGVWSIVVDGTPGMRAIPLAPVKLILRLWRAHDSGTLRGTVRLHGTDRWAPIQSNVQIEQLVQAWLLDDSAPGGNK